VRLFVSRRAEIFSLTVENKAAIVPNMKVLTYPQSGSVAGQTASRNTFGQYIRTRATPVNPATTFQGVVRARLASNASAWRALTDIQRAGWEALGPQISRTDSLGQAYTLNGFMAYCLVNNNKLAAGDATVSAAPALVTPVNIVTLTITLTAALFSLAYTVTPLAANTRMFAFASPQRSAGRSFESDYRLIGVTAAAAASPFNIFTAYQARFGTPVVGSRIFLSIVAYNGGFQEAPFLASQVVA
jgi:hypothetical protein